MDGIKFLSLDGAKLINWLTDNVDDPTKRTFTHRDLNRPAKINGLHPSSQAFSWMHRDTANFKIANMLFGLDNNINWHGHLKALTGYSDSCINFGELALRESHIDHRANNLNYPTDSPSR